MIAIVYTCRAVTAAVVAAANELLESWGFYTQLDVVQTPFGGQAEIQTSHTLADCMACVETAPHTDEGGTEEFSVEYPEREVFHGLLPELTERLALGSRKANVVVLTDHELVARRIQQLVRKGQLHREEDVKILLLHEERVVEIRLRSDGRFADRWPDGFFKEAESEELA